MLYIHLYRLCGRVVKVTGFKTIITLNGIGLRFRVLLPMRLFMVQGYQFRMAERVLLKLYIGKLIAYISSHYSTFSLQFICTTLSVYLIPANMYYYFFNTYLPVCIVKIIKEHDKIQVASSQVIIPLIFSPAVIVITAHFSLGNAFGNNMIDHFNITFAQ